MDNIKRAMVRVAYENRQIGLLISRIARLEKEADLDPPLGLGPCGIADRILGTDPKNLANLDPRVKEEYNKLLSEINSTPMISKGTPPVKSLNLDKKLERAAYPSTIFETISVMKSTVKVELSPHTQARLDSREIKMDFLLEGIRQVLAFKWIYAHIAALYERLGPMGSADGDARYKVTGEHKGHILSVIPRCNEISKSAYEEWLYEPFHIEKKEHGEVVKVSISKALTIEEYLKTDGQKFEAAQIVRLYLFPQLIETFGLTLEQVSVKTMYPKGKDDPKPSCKLLGEVEETEESSAPEPEPEPAKPSYLRQRSRRRRG